MCLLVRNSHPVQGNQDSFQKACELAGIEGLVWHDLRATFGTRLGEAGFDAFTIAQLMGHSDVRTTQRYVRATELNKRAAVEAALLGPNLATREWGEPLG